MNKKFEHPGEVLRRLAEREQERVRRERLYSGPSMVARPGDGYIAAMLGRSLTGCTARACGVLGKAEGAEDLFPVG
jgi:hypothetical protein